MGARHDAPISRPPAPRWLDVPDVARGMRADVFLSRWFRERSRSEIARAMRQGLVIDGDGREIRASQTLRGGERLALWVPGIAPSSAPPPFPTVLYEDDRVVVVDKPAGLLTHPTGTDFAWAVVSLAKERWPDADLVHRIDRDTSGALVLSKDADANRLLKAAFADGSVEKRYQALTRGHVPWDERVLSGPIGPADGPIRIQMAVRDDGLPSRTDVTVLARHPTAAMTWVSCRLHTGRTHQIRVHLAHAGYSLVGDRMYGVPPAVFLRAWEGGVDAEVIAAAGAPRQALHAASCAFPHPDGPMIHVEAPFPADLTRWWADPSVLPHDPGSDQPPPAGRDESTG